MKAKYQKPELIVYENLKDVTGNRGRARGNPRRGNRGKRNGNNCNFSRGNATHP